MEPVLLKLDWCSHEAALYAVKRWHYSGCLPASKLVKIGAWENGLFIGCVIFSRGACRTLGNPYGLKTTEVCELTRVALGEHLTPVSRIIAIAMKLLKGFCPDLRLIVSYADSGQGHHGGIYQAANWIYCGTSISTELLINGVRRHRRSVNCLYGTSELKALRARGIRASSFTTEPKHRYLFALDDRMRVQIAPLAQPYPKRVGSIDVDARGSQPRQGGSSPTPALHMEAANVR